LYYVLIVIWGMFQPFLVFEFNGSTIVVAMAEICWVLIQVHRQKTRVIEGSRILVVGAIPTMLGFIYALGTLNFPKLFPSPNFYDFPIFLYSLLPIMLAMSVFLSRVFANLNHSLSRRLEEVEQLSAANLAQEVERARLSAENERKNKELEEARALQLSMLPQQMPKIPNYQIAAYMKTATEVGGDYYDFQCHPDGSITVLVGDATGHGVKAGNMVVASKGLFDAHGCQERVGKVLACMNDAIKRFRFKNMFMALCLARFHQQGICLTFAGMPPALIYRANDHKVEEQGLKSLPLGVIANRHYEETELTMHPGDILLLMSDGLMERFNPNNRMFGLDRIKKLLSEYGDQDPEGLIKTITAAGEEWGAGRVNDDDITLMVLKHT
jgi:serine phosphatase RsbU (regulator of sigma subunit)